MLNRGEPRPIPKECGFSEGEPALLAVTGNKSKTLVLDKLHDHSDHVLIWKKPHQLAGKAMMPESVISNCQIKKYGTSFLLSLK